MKRLQNEPVITAAMVLALVQAILYAITQFGVDLTAEQTAAIMGVATAAVTIIFAIWTRSQVTPVANPRNNAGQPLVVGDVREPLNFDEAGDWEVMG